MNYDGNAAEFTRQTVVNFRLFDDHTLMSLARDLGLSRLQEGNRMPRCRDHFRMREGRDPTVGELRFLDALAALWAKMPGAAVIQGIDSTPEDTRILNDIIHKENSLLESGAAITHNLPGLMDLAGRYLARCGVLPYHEHFVCGHPAELAARCEGAIPTSAIRLESTAAMLTDAPASPSPLARNLLLLFPTGNAPFRLEAARFFGLHRSLGLCPVAAPKDEGLLPHLLGLGGVIFDISALADYRPDVGAASCLTLGRDGILFLAPDEALPHLFTANAPLVLCGGVTGDQRLLIRRGNEVVLSLWNDLLTALRYTHASHFSLPSRHERQIDRTIGASAASLLGGVTAAGGCVSSAIGLIGEMARQGADLSRATVTAVLEMPPVGANDREVAEALPLILDYHRIICEFALPTCNHRQLMREDIASPQLSVFIAAKSGAPRDEAFTAAWQTAANAQDFSALRRLLRA
ncbi:MAG: hypothetical protein IJX39_05880 [Clostridia bacterium]|nr:hypothetical protein [Clostridia bacterium]